MTQVTTVDIDSIVANLCDQAWAAPAGDVPALVAEACESLAKWAESGHAPAKADVYAECAHTAHKLGHSRVALASMERWVLDKAHWDLILAVVPTGSYLFRRLCVIAGEQGHAQAIAYTVALNGHSTTSIGRNARRDALRLACADIKVRRIAGALAHGWTGSLADLLLAAGEIDAAGPGKQ